MTTLKQLGEYAWIRRLARRIKTRDDVMLGIGDDAAAVRLGDAPTDLLLTSDAVIEGAHFLRTTQPERIGHKAIGRVLSDFAAMGGEPLWALIDFVAPPETSVRRADRIYRGALQLAEKYGLAIVGGDTTQGPRLELHVFGVGQAPRGSAVCRSGARPNDVIYVTGTLGGSLRGKHLDFEPRVQEGLWLREAGWANAMIDVSDGLARDLGHIIEESSVGAELDARRIPISRNARGGSRSPLEHALFDGEDFELLFTVAADKHAAFESSWKEAFRLRCTAIGHIITQKGIWLCSPDGKTPLAPSGFEHFRANDS